MKTDAKLIPIQVISHTDHSRLIEKQGMGEIANAKKFKELLSAHGFFVNPIWDVYEIFGKGLEGITNLAKLTAINGFLAQQNQKIIEDFQFFFVKKIWERIDSCSKQIFFSLTWDFNLAAILGVGLQKEFPMIAKCYCFHEKELIPKTLFDSAHLIITESLLANFRAMVSGINRNRLIYLPHHFPSDAEKYKKNPSFKEKHLHKVADRNQKELKLSKETIVIGFFGRFQFRKNTEFILRIIERLYQEFPQILLLIKGDFDSSADINEGENYTKKLRMLFEQYEKNNWLLWDISHTPFPEVMNEYAICDIIVHLSGAESASNSIVEYMALEKACLALNCSTNPFLFKGGVELIHVKPTIKKGKISFFEPDLDHLYAQLKDLIIYPQKRKELAKKAKEIAKKRFSPEATLIRMPLILESAEAFFFKKNEKKYQKWIVERFEQDLKDYEINLSV